MSHLRKRTCIGTWTVQTKAGMTNDSVLAEVDPVPKALHTAFTQAEAVAPRYAGAYPRHPSLLRWR